MITLAYLASSSATKEKSFITLTPDHHRGASLLLALHVQLQNLCGAQEEENGKIGVFWSSTIWLTEI
jgi:hypothetical protein